jgi:hypothetical protein
MATVYRFIRESWTWKSYVAVLALGLGLLAPILGSMLTIISWFADPEWHGLSMHRAATTLFVVTLPLLLLGAHCLDLLDQDET